MGRPGVVRVVEPVELYIVKADSWFGCPNAAVIWWSGNTRTNGRGSLMAYLPTPDGHTSWYVAQTVAPAPTS